MPSKRNAEQLMVKSLSQKKRKVLVNEILVVQAEVVDLKSGPTTHIPPISQYIGLSQ